MGRISSVKRYKSAYNVVLPRPGTVFASRTLVYIIMGPTAPLVRSLVSCPFVNTDPYQSQHPVFIALCVISMHGRDRHLSFVLLNHRDTPTLSSRAAYQCAP